jgi:hypothetical protein
MQSYNDIVFVVVVVVHVDGVRLYVSELRPPAGLFFIPQMTYEYGEPVE